MPPPLAIAAFALTGLAVIGNDALQTIGPFLAANRQRTPRLWQWLWLAALLTIVLVLGWWRGDGDPSWGRLATFPEARTGWSGLLPPLSVLLLTHWGAPVSTSVLVLTAFAPASLAPLLRHSLGGYGAGLAVGLLAWGVLARLVGAVGGGGPAPTRPAPGWKGTAALGAAETPKQPEGPHKPEALDQADASGTTAATAQSESDARKEAAAAGMAQRSEAAAAAANTSEGAKAPAAAPLPGEPWANGLWLSVQWLTTGWLWCQWLVQDLATIYVVLPRRLSAGAMAGSLALLLLGLALLLMANGGAIQQRLASKSRSSDPRSAVILTATYGLVLFGLGRLSDYPLSTTWVFLGLLGGRELALLRLGERSPTLVLADLAGDLLRAALGLGLSVVVALAVRAGPA